MCVIYNKRHAGHVIRGESVIASGTVCILSHSHHVRPYLGSSAKARFTHSTQCDSIQYELTVYDTIEREHVKEGNLTPQTDAFIYKG